jgi:hypothetical protein
MMQAPESIMDEPGQGSPADQGLPCRAATDDDAAAPPVGAEDDETMAVDSDGPTHRERPVDQAGETTPPTSPREVAT